MKAAFKIALCRIVVGPGSVMRDARSDPKSPECAS